MGTRLQLQALFLTLCDNVYFQPPPTVKMKYPCIHYELSDRDSKFADNKPYANTKKYSVTVMDQDPDSAIPDKIAVLPMCRFDRHFTAEGLNHNVFQLFF